MAQALAAIDAAGDACSDEAGPSRADLAQQHALIRDTKEYGSLFELAATKASSPAGANTCVGGGL